MLQRQKGEQTEKQTLKNTICTRSKKSLFSTYFDKDAWVWDLSSCLNHK